MRVKAKRKEYRDPVIEFYMRNVDRTLLRENLKLTPEQRLQKLARLARLVAEKPPPTTSRKVTGELLFFPR